MIEILNTIFKYKEKKSPDKLGLFPERVHVDAMPERRYLWSSRLLVILAFFSICLNAMLTSTIYVMLPQVSSHPRLIQINKYFSQLEVVQPTEISYPVESLIIENYITDYIMLRYMITNDYDEMVERWGVGSTVFWYSDPQVYREFSENDAEYNLSLFKGTSMLRDVEVDWVRPLARGVWFAQYRTLDYMPGSTTPSVQIWRVTMRVTFVNLPFEKKEDAIINPFGFLITKFSVGYYGTPETSAHYLQTAKQISEESIRRLSY